MAVAFVGASSAKGAASVTVSKPSGVASGHLLLMRVYTDGSAVSTPTGWTAFGGSFQDGNYFTVQTFYKTAGSSEPASYVVSATSALITAAAVLAYSGVWAGAFGGPGGITAYNSFSWNWMGADAAGGPTNTPGNTVGTGGSASPRQTTAPGGMAVYFLMTGTWYSTSAMSAPALSGVSGATVRTSIAGTTTNDTLLLAAADAPLPAGSYSVGTWSYTGPTSQPDGQTILLAPANSAPYAPTLTAPAPSAVLATDAAQTFAWTYSDPDLKLSDGQSAYALRRKLSTDIAYSWWNGTAWVATETWVTTTAHSVTLPAGSLPSGQQSWSVATKDSSGTVGPYSGDAAFSAAATPVVTITAPTAGATVGASAAVTYTVANGPEGTSSGSTTIVVASSAQYSVAGYDPGAHVNSGYWGRNGSATVQFASSVPYRIYVRTTATSGLQSAWTYVQVTAVVSTVPAPVLTAADNPSAAAVSLSFTTLRNRISQNSSTCYTDTSAWSATGTTSLSAGGVMPGLESTPVQTSLLVQVGTSSDRIACSEVIPVTGGEMSLGLSVVARCLTTNARVDFRAYLDFYNATGALVGSGYLAGQWTVDHAVGTVVLTNSSAHSNVPATATTAQLRTTAAFSAGSEGGTVPTSCQFQITGMTVTAFGVGDVTNVGTLGNVLYTLDRSGDGGTTWAAVRGCGALVPAWGVTSLAATDYEALTQTSLLYRVHATVNPIGAVVNYTFSPMVVSAPLTRSQDDWFVVDPLANSAGQLLNVQSQFEHDEEEPQSVIHPLGRENAVVVSGVIHSESGSLDLVFFDEASFQAFQTLRRSQRTLLLQSPFGFQYYVRLGAVRKSVLVSGQGTNRVRNVSIDWVEVDTP